MLRAAVMGLAAMVVTTLGPMGTPAAASIVESKRPDCAIELSGEIAAGDARQLAAIAEAAGLTRPIESGEPNNSGDMALCLDSPGGSYQEGQAMARLMHQHGIATRILADAECYASCAFVFMAGRFLGGEMDGPRRILTVGGRLGFQAPILTISPQASFSGVDISVVATRSMQLVADLMGFAAYKSIFDYRPMYAMSLLEQLLRTGPDEMVLVNTVEDVGRWTIELAGHREQHRLDDLQLIQACTNFQEWSMDRPSRTVTDVEWLLPLPRSSLSIWGETMEFALVETGGMEVSNCQLQASAQPVDWFAICSRDDFNGVNFGACHDNAVHWVPWYYGLAPDTPLSDLR